MSALFFLMAFVNTIIDSLKDSLVITAVGGGTQVLPYLSVYAVLPSSILFLVAYSWATRRFSRDKLFNGIVCVFMLFYGMFAFAYPYHEALHLSSWADGLAAILPSGLSGMVGMVRNWMFTLFYCGAELWGDVVLSLLFWGLANETTSIEDAPLLYPLFGLGANLAQTIAGRFLRLFSDAAGVHVSYTMQLQATVGLCVAMGCVIIVLHTFISKTFPKNPKGSTSAKLAGARAQAAAAAAEAAAMVKREEEHRHHQIKLDLEASVRGLNYCDLDTHNGIDKGTKTAWSSANGSSVEARASINSNNDNDNNNNSTGDHDRTQHSMTSSVTPSTSGNASSYSVARKEDQAENSSTSAYSPSPPSHPGNGNATPSVQKSSSSAEAATSTSKVPSSMSLKDAWEFLRRSPQIRCLAVMAVAQGITTRLLEVTWKHYLHQLHSSPAAYAAFLGDTAMWTGIVTGSLMFTSPLLFDRIGWKGVASVTPKFMLWFGVPFFVGCIAYNLFSGHVLATGTVTLQALVIVGALLQVFSRGAKFSLFKPAEEMVYIGLDDESRTKGTCALYCRF
jgi:ATP:ADP antiporter, AAA family